MALGPYFLRPALVAFSSSSALSLSSPASSRLSCSTASSFCARRAASDFCMKAIWPSFDSLVEKGFCLSLPSDCCKASLSDCSSSSSLSSSSLGTSEASSSSSRIVLPSTRRRSSSFRFAISVTPSRASWSQFARPVALMPLAHLLSRCLAPMRSSALRRSLYSRSSSDRSTPSALSCSRSFSNNFSRSLRCTRRYALLLIFLIRLARTSSRNSNSRCIRNSARRLSTSSTGSLFV